MIPTLGTLLALFMPSQAAAPELVVRGRYLMGSVCEIRAFGPDAERTGEAIEAALDRIEAIENAMTTWRPEGELARLNAACRDAPASVAVSEDLARSLSAAREWAARTGGAFDPTIGALVAAWGLHEGGRVPDEQALAGAMARTSWRLFEVDLAARSVSCGAGVELDLGGFGKGYALDEAAAVLRGRGLSAALLNFGGQVLALGAPPGESGFIVSLAHPSERDRPVAELLLRDASLSTSSNAERGFVVRGRRYGHVLDPRTGRPARWRVSVSVLAGSGAAADALSTALLVAGRDRAAALVPAGVEFVALERQGRHRARVACGTPALVARLAWVDPR